MVARSMVDSGRVVPGLTIEPGGRARSWWWPLPAADDLSALSALVDGDTIDAHRVVAESMAAYVDAEVRRRLGEHRIGGPRRSGRRTVPEAWLHALFTADPWLPAATDAAKATALATTIAEWVRGGAVRAVTARLCLRIDEPASDDGPWTVVALAQSIDEPSLVRPVGEVLDGPSLFADGSAIEVLAGLGRAVRVAPELRPLIEAAVPDAMELDGASAWALVVEHAELLQEAGVAVLLPAWWTRRGRVRLRAKVKSTRSTPTDATVGGGLGMDAVLAFSWEAVLGEQALTKAEVAALTRAASARSSVVRMRGEWVEVDPAELAAIAKAMGVKGTATARELVRAGLGLEHLGAPAGVALGGVTATGWLGDLLDDALHATVEAIEAPDGFSGQLRPYQQRGVGWLSFLGRLGLGACLADDMGLGKTAQLIASLLADPAPGPALVVCPVSVLGNWQREIERFAPALRILVHHGPDRFEDDDRPFADRCAEADVVLTTYSLVARDVATPRRRPLGPAGARRGPADQEPGHGPGPGGAADPGRPAGRAHRHARREPPRRAVVDHARAQPGAARLAARSSGERFAIPVERDGDVEATERLRRDRPARSCSGD